MNDVWKKIFRNYVDSYRAIKTLDKNNIIEEEDVMNIKCKLLEDIICTMESEIED